MSEDTHGHVDHHHQGHHDGHGEEMAKVMESISHMDEPSSIQHIIQVGSEINVISSDLRPIAKIIQCSHNQYATHISWAPLSISISTRYPFGADIVLRTTILKIKTTSSSQKVEIESPPDSTTVVRL